MRSLVRGHSDDTPAPTSKCMLQETRIAVRMLCLEVSKLLRNGDLVLVGTDRNLAPRARAGPASLILCSDRSRQQAIT
jgi:hypothetical protein